MDEDVVGPIFFFVMIIAVVWLRVWRSATLEKERQQTVRLAIERGQQLDAALVEKLLTPVTPSLPKNPYSLPFGFISAGLGVAIFGGFMRQIEDEAFWPITGAGCIILLVGLGLLAAVKMGGRLNARNDLQAPGM